VVEVAFDGGVHGVEGHCVASAGAVLWGVDPRSGLIHRVAEAEVAMPNALCSQIAEAWDSRAAVGLLRDGGAACRSLSVGLALRASARAYLRCV